ncbi:PREDICTED: T-cell surface antigen CD2 [Lepidothrix coronata]|uniref:T-cell surface antigen CD2 n=1 Tax=Lepidothrix coronata TaxID=321398 RepID=A0A6J0IHU7_9PASS|nr:PREDICTED: T-cell surface antigen CD2 [Lepidothrix coronata]
MNFGRIFLVKCLLLLFSSVKCSVVNRLYKAVNETALLNITAPGSIYHAIWKRDGQRLVQLKDNDVKYFVNKDQCRCKILQNGTLQIRQVVKGDSGNYTVTVYERDGKWKAEEKTSFFVQEPVPQPILSTECMNRTVSVKCEVDHKAKGEEFTIELTQPNGRKIQKNAAMLELQTRHSGTFRCAVKNQVSEKMVEKAIKCSGKLDLYLILSIAGGALVFVISVIWLIYCIRRRKAKRREGDDEQRMMQTLPAECDRAMRELPPTPYAPTPKQVRVQQRPLPQPQGQQQPQPPRPRPRTQPRTPNHPKERP